MNFIEGLDVEKLVSGLALEDLGPCPLCARSIEAGQPVAAQEDVTTAHARCMQAHVAILDVMHDRAHALSAALMEVVDKFIGDNGGVYFVPAQIPLAATEQLASVWRRLVKEGGMSKVEAVTIQREAIECSRGIVAHMQEHDGRLPGTDACHTPAKPAELPASPVEIPWEHRVALGNIFGGMVTRALSGVWTGEPEEV